MGLGSQPGLHESRGREWLGGAEGAARQRRVPAPPCPAPSACPSVYRGLFGLSLGARLFLNAENRLHTYIRPLAGVTFCSHWP